MALLNSILEYKPDTWDERDYDDVRFVRIPLQKRSGEFREIEAEFLGKFGSDKAVLGIERIQHPFAYGRYQIRKRHLQKLNGRIPSEKRVFYAIYDSNKIDQILEFNCDERRGGCMYNKYGYSSLSSEYVLVVNTFSDYGFDERDTHRYPEYLIRHEKNNTRSNDLGYLFDQLKLY
ncbi:hypothetical protein ILUMI_25270 [Ignelater luminosus]|uniref:Uncharacterized protein n=1 Tax=Ignelater luminosus TaxID=2038154 RepID=A0A8K0C7N3_IGNLU|nr:hypothetical protein ILUMI_25270 [Ignelater luminosus]